MGASASKGRAARVPAPQSQPAEGLDLSRLPPELLLTVLSHVPPRVLLRRCRLVCRGWRALVDGQALWLLILAQDHSATGRALLSLVRSCLPPPATPSPALSAASASADPLDETSSATPADRKAFGSGWCSTVEMAGWWKTT